MYGVYTYIGVIYGVNVWYIYHTWIIWEITMLKPDKKDVIGRRLHLDKLCQS